MEKKNVIRRNHLKLSQNRFVWICSVAALLSLGILVVFWFTNIFRDSILSNLELQNGTSTFIWWQRPPVRLVYKIYIFNYTNIDAFESGKVNKLRVQEVGPYIYRETLYRENVVIHNNDTLTYQERRFYQWEGGRPDDETLVVPNVPLLTAIAFSRDMSFTVQIGLTALLTTMRIKPFVHIPAGGFLWGYDDKIFQMGKSFMALRHPIPMDKFGMLASKIGVSEDRITIHAGSKNIDQLGQVQRLNGMESRDVWGDEKCDRIQGTDGSMFPPYLLRNSNAPLQIYMKDICRTVSFDFHGYSSTFGIPSLRYKVPNDTFTSSRTKNTCYCPKQNEGSSTSEDRICPPAGLFNMSACAFGMPTVVSFPHFYAADKSLLDQIDGLHPQQELHETFIDLHPRIGVPIGGWSRLQLNVEVRKAVGMPFLGKLKEGTILPLIWAEAGIDHLPEPVLSVLNQAYFTAATVEASLQWGSLFFVIFFTAALLYIFNQNRDHRHIILQRNESGESKLIEDTLQ